MINIPQEGGRELVVPLRPSETVVATVSLLAFIGAMILLLWLLMLPTFAPSAPIYPALTASLCLALMVPASVCIFYRCHARLVLSENSLRWRTWGDWRRVSWDGVRDYFDLPPQGSSTGDGLMAIRTDAGDVLLSGKRHEREAVRRWVQARATQAGVTEWGVQGERSCASDKRTFRYGQKDFWTTSLIFGVLFLPWTVYGWYEILRLSGRHFFTGIWTPGDFWGSLILIIFAGIMSLFGLVTVNLPLFIFLALLPGMLETRKRREERIIVGQSGIAFENGKRKISADWDEVTGNFLQPSAYFKSPFFRATAVSSSPLHMWRWVHVVETTRGSFEYSSLIEGSKQLGEIIAARALPLEERKGPPLPVGSEAGRV